MEQSKPVHSVDARTQPDAFGPAADIAAVGAFLEIIDRLRITSYFERGEALEPETLAAAAGVPVAGIRGLLEALNAAAIIEPVDGEGEVFHAVPSFRWLRNQAGYVSWAMNANRAFIEHSREFIEDSRAAGETYHRDMREVAVSSQWMGAEAFYPALLETIFQAKPTRIVDLGAGSGGLLIEVLTAFPGATGVALDLAADACAAAQAAAWRAGVADRLTVVEAPIQSLSTDPAVLAGADVITAGFVFHDMMPEESEVADLVLRNCRNALAAGGMMAITDAVPYPAAGWERRFGALVTYMHKQFMGRELLTESEWCGKLAAAGFSAIRCIRQAFPSGRLFVANP